MNAQYVAPKMNPSELLAYGLQQARKAGHARKFPVYGVWHNGELVFYAYGRRSAAARWAGERENGFLGALTVTYMGRG
jgi:hypothetical protein